MRDRLWLMSPKPPRPEDASLLMVAAAGRDRTAADRLLPLVYEQLRNAAPLGSAGERAGHTPSATILVHEADLKLVGPPDVGWASTAMRSNASAVSVAKAKAPHEVVIAHAPITRHAAKRLWIGATKAANRRYPAFVAPIDPSVTIRPIGRSDPDS